MLILPRGLGAANGPHCDSSASYSRPTNLVPTAVPFVDSLLGGGAIAGGVHVILGDTGSGRSTLAIQIAIAAARRNHAASLRGAPLQLVTVINFNNDAKAFGVRAVATAARVRRERLEQYGRRGLEADERSRVEHARSWLPRVLFSVDADALRADQWLPGLDSRLSAIEDAAGHAVSTLIVDDAGLAERRRVMAENPHCFTAAFGHALAQTIGAIEDTISRPRGLVAWATHYAAAPRWARLTGDQPLPVEAAYGSAAFCNRACGILTIGRHDWGAQRVLVSCPRPIRGQAGQQFCRLDGDFGEFAPVGSLNRQNGDE